MGLNLLYVQLNRSKEKILRCNRLRLSNCFEDYIRCFQYEFLVFCMNDKPGTFSPNEKQNGRFPPRGPI